MTNEIKRLKEVVKDIEAEYTEIDKMSSLDITDEMLKMMNEKPPTGADYARNLWRAYRLGKRSGLQTIR
jgi:hypothetical protein